MSMHEKIVVITGATSGIGQVAAERLAQQGARIVQIARDLNRGEAALQRLKAIHPDAQHSIYYADLSNLNEMKRVGSEIATNEPRIDVLINNAGAMFSSLQQTSDGLERTFALNHLAYHVLTHCLLDRLRASAPARIISTASDAHESARLDLDDLQSFKVYRDGGLAEWLRYGGPGYQVYARSKLCNILFTRALARRLAGSGVNANCVHPGFVATRFGNEAGGLISFSMRIGKRFALSPEEGAETLVHLASSPEMQNVSGQYFAKGRAIAPSAAAQDDTLAEELWQRTASIANL